MFFGRETKDHTLNRTAEFLSKTPKDGEFGLWCTAEPFGGDPLPGVVKSCFCSTNTTKKNATALFDSENVAEEYTWGQIKLIGNQDGRTVMINTTERNITATLSVHLNLNNLKGKKRPQGNNRDKKSKMAFVQDNGDAKQMWKKETHPKVPGAFRLVDEGGYCLWVNAPKEMKRSKPSSYVTAVPDKKGKCTFFEKKQSGDGWNIVMVRPGTKSGQKDKYSYMNGWALAVHGWCKSYDCELGPDATYIVAHGNKKKWSIWTSRIFAAPANVTYALTNNITVNDTVEEENDTADANDTSNATDTTPAAAPAAATPAAAPAAAGATATPANATNGTNKTKKDKKKKKKAKKLPVPYAGDDSDDEALGQDLSYDIDEEEDYGDYDMREKVDRAS